MTILMIDNHDSFTYNLVDQLQQTGHDVNVVQRENLPATPPLDSDFTHVVISPGPGSPEELNPYEPFIRTCIGSVPVLGVCLGHQWLATLFGAEVGVMPHPIHGHASIIQHTGTALFTGIDNPCSAMRYHSWHVSLPLPEALEELAWCHNGDGQKVNMAFRHRELPVFGLQFHPESILTPTGLQMVRNFLAEA